MADGLTCSLGTADAQAASASTVSRAIVIRPSRFTAVDLHPERYTPPWTFVGAVPSRHQRFIGTS
jgi:hypothetical protein